VRAKRMIFTDRAWDEKAMGCASLTHPTSCRFRQLKLPFFQASLLSLDKRNDIVPNSFWSTCKAPNSWTNSQFHCSEGFG